MQNLRTRNRIHLGKNYQRVNCQNNCVQKPTRILPGIHKVTFCASKGKYTHVIFYKNYPQVSVKGKYPRVFLIFCIHKGKTHGRLSDFIYRFYPVRGQGKCVLPLWIWVKNIHGFYPYPRVIPTDFTFMNTCPWVYFSNIVCYNLSWKLKVVKITVTTL